jgi:hypothetical protein
MEGWIKLHRKFIEWGWYKTPYMTQLFIHLLLIANRESKMWQGVEVKRGQIITGRKKISEDTGISEQTIRTCFERLKSTNELTIKSTNKFSIITITNYDNYQNTTDKINQQINQDANQQSTNNQPTTNHKQEYKEIKERKKKNPNKSGNFIDQLLDVFIEEHGDYVLASPGKQRSAMGKLLEIYKQEHPNLDTKKTLNGMRIFFIKCLRIQEPFYKGKIEPSFILSQYNQIKHILENGEFKEKQKGANGEDIAHAVAKIFASDRKEYYDSLSEN